MFICESNLINETVAKLTLFKHNKKLHFQNCRNEHELNRLIVY